MTKIIREKHKCAVCGTVNEYCEIVSTNTFGGGPDLDLRPGEMERSTMFAWLQECPECGYVSSNIEDPMHLPKDYLQSEEYLTCEGINFRSDLARQFYRHFMICLENEKISDAFHAVLHAAWACDDENDSENAIRCRKIAIELVNELIEEKNSLILIKADLMRRSGEYDELIEEYSSVHFNQDVMDTVLAFQIEKAKLKDPSCYRIEEVNSNNE